MSEAKETGGAAFPIVFEKEDYIHDGMTLRDYFAAKAMQGFAADGTAVWSDGVKGMARTAYIWADAMLEERTDK